MLYTYAATALLSAGMAFYGGWSVNQWRHDSEQKQAIEQAAASERELHAMEQKRSAGVIAAVNVARTREAKLRADAAGARDALDGLRTQSDAAMRAGRDSLDACVISAAAAHLVLNQCGAAYQDLGATADRHVSDIETMTAAWPK